MPIPRIASAHTAVLIVDMQAGLMPHIHDGDAVIAQTQRLLSGSAVLEVPMLVTEQYPKGLGATVPQVARHLDGAAARCEKLQFSAYVPQVKDELVRRGVRTVLVAGVEAHVCILQTCLDLAEQGYVVAVAVDAIGSRRAMDRDIAVRRLVQAGIVLTTVESALMEMVHDAGGPTFKAMLPIVK
ncbi:MAG: isochorismatase family protein [Phycisphaeraceae bacterium]